MSIPRLFLGGAGGSLFMADVGSSDAGEPIEASARPLPAPPAGIGGECAVLLAYLAVSHTGSGRIRLVPIIDGRRVPASGEVIELEASPELTVRAFEIGLFEPLIVAGREYARQSLIGTWATVEITAENVEGGTLTFEALELEIAVLRRGKDEDRE